MQLPHVQFGYIHQGTGDYSASNAYQTWEQWSKEGPAGHYTQEKPRRHPMDAITNDHFVVTGKELVERIQSGQPVSLRIDLNQPGLVRTKNKTAIDAINNWAIRTTYTKYPEILVKK
jgi:hypothetical protein